MTANTAAGPSPDHRPLSAAWELRMLFTFLNSASVREGSGSKTSP